MSKNKENSTRQFNTAQVRVVSINGSIIVGRREQSVADISKWHERDPVLRKDSTVKVLSLLDKYRGRTIAEIIGGAEFDASDLPMFISEFRGKDEAPAAIDDEDDEPVEQPNIRRSWSERWATL